MKLRYLTAGLLASTLLLTACGQGEKNEDTKSESKSDSGNKNDGSGFSNSSKKDDSNSSSEHSSSHSDSKDNSNSNDDSSENEDTNSPQYLAKVWAAALPSYRTTEEGDLSIEKITHYDASGNVLNPYNPDNTVTLPEGTQALLGDSTAAGQVYYKNNGDGTIDVYDIPSHFQDDRWLKDDDYSQRESERIMNNPKVVHLYDGNQAVIDRWADKMVEGGQLEQDLTDFSSDSDSDSSSEDDSSSDDSSSSEEVTRENVIDKVEEYEGHNLDTSTYTYKEPEQKSDGSWGFSFDDKDGNLAGSYIVDPDGNVTEYDADGNEV
ncbi:hypothetical protein EIG99_00205 [Staphylococcus condimenti]|uniref:Lipoprotein n=1 Tax=Staphylococcus condimenti TaxID=70255 RepID=A0A4Q7CX16_9STAP|nr:hypothetical protein [Staphylococcus condimenti]RZI04968.1 hypothetical protein EIG99_00205 [Staphylococcus condimenti]RZI05819.1 hypothetical protein EIG98_00180 [Staphylococcus condimenti]